MDEPVLHTNIVPIASVETSPEQEGNEVSQVENSETEQDYARKLAHDALDFLDTEFKEDTNEMFWQTIKEHCEKKLGKSDGPITTQYTINEVVPMDEKQAKQFAMQTIPSGKLEGQRVGTVLKKDVSQLEEYANNPTRFQAQLRRFLASPLKKIFKTPKKKPVKKKGK